MKNNQITKRHQSVTILSFGILEALSQEFGVEKKIMVIPGFNDKGPTSVLYVNYENSVNGVECVPPTYSLHRLLVAIRATSIN